MKKIKLLAAFMAVCLLGSGLASCGGNADSGSGSTFGSDFVSSSGSSASDSSLENPAGSEICSHEYILSEDGTQYVCEHCGDAMSSGKGELVNDTSEDKELIPEEGKMQISNYLFLGSSITNGYDPTVENPTLDSSHYSMADMFAEDYLTADYKIYRDGELQAVDGVYMRKIASSPENPDGVAGTYRYDYDTVVLNGDGTGKFNDTEFEYILVGDEIRLKQPIGYLFAFTAKYDVGDTVYKYARDGFTLSYVKERYTAEGEKIENAYNQSYVGLLKEAIERLGSERIDTMFVQLSTNDIGQYKTPAGVSGGHLDFGSVSADSVKNPEEFDVNTSFGALEYIVAKAMEVWNCKVVIYVCHMNTSEFSAFKSNSYDYSKMDSSSDYAVMRNAALRIAEKWDLGVIDLWGNAEVNKALHEDASRYIADTLHLHVLGYERVLWQEFRKYADGRTEE